MDPSPTKGGDPDRRTPVCLPASLGGSYCHNDSRTWETHVYADFDVDPNLLGKPAELSEVQEDFLLYTGNCVITFVIMATLSVIVWRKARLPT